MDSPGSSRPKCWQCGEPKKLATGRWQRRRSSASSAKRAAEVRATAACATPSIYGRSPPSAPLRRPGPRRQEGRRKRSSPSPTGPRQPPRRHLSRLPHRPCRLRRIDRLGVSPRRRAGEGSLTFQAVGCLDARDRSQPNRSLIQSFAPGHNIGLSGFRQTFEHQFTKIVKAEGFANTQFTDSDRHGYITGWCSGA